MQYEERGQPQQPPEIIKPIEFTPGCKLRLVANGLQLDMYPTPGSLQLLLLPENMVMDTNGFGFIVKVKNPDGSTQILHKQLTAEEHAVMQEFFIKYGMARVASPGVPPQAERRAGIGPNITTSIDNILISPNGGFLTIILRAEQAGASKPSILVSPSPDLTQKSNLIRNAQGEVTGINFQANDGNTYTIDFALMRDKPYLTTLRQFFKI